MRALLVIDCQNDFITGSLAVGAAEIIPIINDLQKKFNLVIYTQDYHPANHSSFTIFGGIWPPHCVQGTDGVAFHPDLEVRALGSEATIVQKGTDKAIDSYSGFYDNDHKHATGLKDLLNSVTEVYVVGIALDYCVKFTALDAVTEGFKTFLVIDACRAVNINPGDDGKAILDMIKAGVGIVHSKNVE